MFQTVYPTPYPTGFTIFGVEIKFYAIFILSGAILCTLYGFLRFGKRMHMSSDLVLEGLALGLLFGVIGSRLYYVLFEHEGINTFWDIFNTRQGGLAIHGAIISTAIFLPIWTKIKHVKLLTLIEIVVPLFMMAQVIGRWGNFMNQEAFGPLIGTFGDLTVDNIQANSVGGLGTWANPYILSDTALDAQREFMKSCLMPDFIVNQMYITDGWVVIDGVKVFVTGYYHPTFLYESLMNFSLVLFMMIGRKHIKHYYVGDSIGVYLIGYGVVRYIIESLRTDPLTIGDTGIKVAQVISILFVIGGITLLILRRVFKYKLVSCKEELYGNGSLIKEGYDSFGKPIKKEEVNE